MPAVLNPFRTRGSAALSIAAIFLATLALLFALTSSSTPCALAQSASCPVGDDEEFAGNIGFDSDTSFTVTFDHAATADRTVTIQDATDTLVGRATTDTLTNKSIALGSNTVTGTSAQLATALSDETGSGAAVFATSPTIASPTITTSPTAAGATWTNLGSVTTVDINGGTLDGTTIGGASAAAGTFTTVSGTTITASTGFELGDGDYIGIGAALERLNFATAGTITANGADFLVANGNGVVIGHTAQITVGGVVHEFQLLGTALADSGSVIGLFANDGNGPVIRGIKSRSGTIGSQLIVADNDPAYVIQAYADDGVDYATQVGELRFEVDDAAPAASSIGGALAVQLGAGTGADDLREVWRWNAAGQAILGGDQAYVSGNGIALILDQGSDDGNILVLKSSDVGTGLSTAPIGNDVQTDDYFALAKSSATLGGAFMQVLAEDAALETPFQVEVWGGTATTAKTTAGRGLINLYATEHDGANAAADITADGNVFSITARVGGANVARFLVDEDGDSFTFGSAALAELSGDPAGVSGFAHVYAKSATSTTEVFVRDSAGNVTQISPHDPTTNHWAFQSCNDYSGRCVSIDMEALSKALEAVTGQSLVNITWKPNVRNWANDEQAAQAARSVEIARYDAALAKYQADLAAYPAALAAHEVARAAWLAELATWNDMPPAEQRTTPRPAEPLAPNKPAPPSGPRPAPYTPRPAPAWLPADLAQRELEVSR